MNFVSGKSIAVPEDGSCETGWLQFRQDQCYRFVHIRLTFDDAETLCNNLYGGHLPSIHSQEEQFMISQFLASVNVKNGSEIWLGGRQMDFHNFNWGDGSLFNYSYWEHGEPSFPAEKCIEMSWRNGRWNDINCRLKRAVLCERQVTSRHHVKPNLYQPTTCLDLSNCTSTSQTVTLTAAPSAVPIASGTGQQGTVNGSELAIATAPGDPTDQPNQHVTTNTTSLLNDNNSTIESTTNNTRSLSSPGGATTELMLPPDDKPIKVITSIMNGERQTVASSAPAELVPFLNVTSVSSDANGTSFIHYNLPPPDRILSSTQPGGGGGGGGSDASSKMNNTTGDSQTLDVSGKKED